MGQIVPVAEGWKSSSPGRYGHDSGGRLINAYAESASASGKMQYPVYPIEGFELLSTTDEGEFWRAGIEIPPYGYIVNGWDAYRVAHDGGYTNLGGILSGDPVFMARNRKRMTPQIAITTNRFNYMIEDDVVSQIADADLPVANSVAFVGGYFVWSIHDGRFFISAVDEGATIDALDFATAEAQPDGLVAVYAVRQELALFGSTSIEFWAQTGATFPFERIPGTTINGLGLLGANTVRDLNDVPFFLASDGTVRMLDGYQPIRVSTHDQERDIDAQINKGAISATAYPWQGHQFYILSSPSWTWAYDVVTGLWHERKSAGVNRWRGEGYLNIAGVPVVGDYANGKLYKLSSSAYDEAGGHLRFHLQTPPIHAYPHSLVFDRMFVDTIPGTGLNSTDTHDSTPEVMLKWSDDGGKSFGPELTKQTGKKGEFTKKVVFNRLGQSGEDGRIFDVSMSAAVIRGLTGAAVDAELTEP